VTVKGDRPASWHGIRERALKRAGWCCQECGINRYQAGVLEVHHLTYDRLGAELDEDLRVLCRKCHYDVHNPIVFYDD
jgi:5-methylcytosine-specific restriction endonuclease McrA